MAKVIIDTDTASETFHQEARYTGAAVIHFLNEISMPYALERKTEKAYEKGYAAGAKVGKEAKPVAHQQGMPLWGYCPSCDAKVTKTGSPVGCKWCLQRVIWRDEE